MVRTLLSLLLVVLCSATLLAQDRKVKVELRSGKIIVGLFKDADDDAVYLTLPKGDLRISRTEIATLEEFVPVAKPAAELPRKPAGEEPEVGEPGWKLPAVTAAVAPEISLEAAAPDSHTAAPPGSRIQGQVAPRGPVGSAKDTDARIVGLLERYLWIVPEAGGNKISLGVVIFLMLVMMIQLSSKMANLENRSLSRSGLLASLLYIIAAIEFGVAPSELPFLVGVVIVNLALWYLFTCLVYSAGAYGSTIMLASFTMSSLLAVLCLEVMGFVLQEGTIT